MTASVKPTAAPRKRRVMSGVVVKRSGDKTVAVAISRTVVHPLYQKRAVRVKKYLVHDPENKANVGDRVTIQETRPLSRSKRWILVTHNV